MFHTCRPDAILDATVDSRWLTRTISPGCCSSETGVGASGSLQAHQLGKFQEDNNCPCMRRVQETKNVNSVLCVPCPQQS